MLRNAVKTGISRAIQGLIDCGAELHGGVQPSTGFAAAAGNAEGLRLLCDLDLVAKSMVLHGFTPLLGPKSGVFDRFSRLFDAFSDGFRQEIEAFEA